GRRAETRERHALRPQRLGLDERRDARRGDRPKAGGRDGLGEPASRDVRVRAVRRREGVGPRTPVFGARPQELHGTRGRERREIGGDRDPATQRREAVVASPAAADNSRSPSWRSLRKSTTSSYALGEAGGTGPVMIDSDEPGGICSGKRSRIAALNISRAAQSASDDSDPNSSSKTCSVERSSMPGRMM